MFKVAELKAFKKVLKTVKELNGSCRDCKAGKWKMAQSGESDEVLNEKCLLRLRRLRKLLSN